LLYGSDSAAFKEAADVVNLPENRRETCVADAEQMGKSWDKLLSPYYAANDGLDNAKAPDVSYRDTKTYNAQVDYLKEHKILENISEFMRQSYKLIPGIKVIAEECGESNSFWYPKERELFLCYELVADFQRLAAKIEH
jgi:Putative metallopeptidase